MIDKGYTRAAFRKIKKIMPDEFSLMAVGANTGMFARAVRYGILEKLGTGRYRVVPGIKDPWKAYTNRTEVIRHEGKRPKGSHVQLPMPTSAGQQQSAGPRVRVIPYFGDSMLIIVGKQVFMGVEVALVPKQQRRDDV